MAYLVNACAPPTELAVTRAPVDAFCPTRLYGKRQARRRPYQSRHPSAESLLQSVGALHDRAPLQGSKCDFSARREESLRGITPTQIVVLCRQPRRVPAPADCVVPEYFLAMSGLEAQHAPQASAMGFVVPSDAQSLRSGAPREGRCPLVGRAMAEDAVRLR
jgi:hypothetical protein